MRGSVMLPAANWSNSIFVGARVRANDHRSREYPLDSLSSYNRPKYLRGNQRHEYQWKSAVPEKARHVAWRHALRFYSEL